ncbi:hypothetical protein CPB85DRAFT_1427685 [Mucidula mucida]|nr:hypothetical protein CPB85DRAFT_1427685 [Mucidula mucida]
MSPVVALLYSVFAFDTVTSPFHLLPQPQEHVLLLDFQPDSNSPPPVRSISKAVTVTGIKVDEGIVAAPVDGRNEKMYIIETTSLDDPQRQEAPELSMKSPRDVLSEFKSKNAILRRALHYPEIHKVDTTSTLSPTSPLPISPLQ